MKKIFLLACIIVGSITVYGQSQNDLLPLLKQELQYNMEELQKQEIPPYYISLRVNDVYSVNISSSFGNTGSCDEVRTRTVLPQIRLGSRELDNFKYSTQSSPDNRYVSYIPLENKFTEGIRDAIWNEMLMRYNYASDVYAQTKMRASTRVEDEDKSPCFSEAPAERFYEPPLEEGRVKIDKKTWEKRLNEVSAVFKSFPELLTGSVNLDYQVSRAYFVNTEGSEIAQNRVAARIIISAQLTAADGMDLPLSKDYFSFEADKLPDTQTMIADVKDIIVRLQNLRTAPVAEPYTGPAIMSGPASGVFFHEIFGHRLESHRMKKGGQTFNKMVNQQILPREFQVYCDPTLRNYAGVDMNGYYLYDEEGVKARRVDNVKNGILNEFLTSRIPIDGFPSSNGHGRATGVNDPVSRQSNLVVETDKPYSDAELRKMLIMEAQKQGKEYGYFFKSVTSGFTYTGEGGSLNSFNVTPLEVYRVFVNGSPDELVRGVDMIGTPLAMFSNIVAAGDQPDVFTGSCGAESGWIPVTASSPMIYVSKIETQRRQQSRDIPPILPAPAFKDTVIANTDDVIMGALNDELERNKETLRLSGAADLYYLSYFVTRYRRFQMVASLGGITNSVVSPWDISGNAQVLVGNFKNNSEIQPGQYVQMTLGTEPDYSTIRRNFWRASDIAYKFSLSNYTQKMNYLKANPLPPDLENIPDQQALPAVTKIEQLSKEFVINKKYLEKVVSELSGLFLDYKDLQENAVILSGFDANIYRRTSENVLLKQPQGVIQLKINASVRTNDGATINDFYEVYADNPADFPSIDQLKESVRSFAGNLLKFKDAPAMNEYYKGPVLVEDEAVSSIFANNLLRPGFLLAEEKTSRNSQNNSGNKLDRKIIDSRLTIKNYSSLPKYNGIHLMGYYETDADGVRPEKELTLVEKGVFKRILNGSTPSQFASQSTGSARLSNIPTAPIPQTYIGTLHIQSEGGIKKEEMKRALLNAAKEDGLKYTYIVRLPKGSTLLKVFRVDVNSGEETMVRTNGLSLPSLDNLSELIAVSSEENVQNVAWQHNASIIYPAGIIIKNLEIEKDRTQFEKEPAIPYPLKRIQ